MRSILQLIFKQQSFYENECRDSSCLLSLVTLVLCTFWYCHPYRFLYCFSCFFYLFSDTFPSERSVLYMLWAALPIYTTGKCMQSTLGVHRHIWVLATCKQGGLPFFTYSCGNAVEAPNGIVNVCMHSCKARPLCGESVTVWFCTPVSSSIQHDTTLNFCNTLIHVYCRTAGPVPGF